jgi:hypothetical protein
MNKDDQEFFSRIKKGADNKHFILLSKRKVPSVPPLHQQDIKNDKVMKMIDKRLAYWDKVKEDFRREHGFTPCEMVVFPIKGFTATLYLKGIGYNETTNDEIFDINLEDTTEETPPDLSHILKCYNYSTIIGFRKHQYLKEEISRKHVINFLKSEKTDTKTIEKFIKPLLQDSAWVFGRLVMAKMASCVGKPKCSWTGSNKELKA